MSDNFLVAQDVRKIYDNDGKEVRAVSGVSLKLAKGRSVAIVGQSGAGKSTLLHILGGLDRPTSGHVTLDNVDMYRFPEGRRGFWRGS